MDSNPIAIGSYYMLELYHTDDGEPYLVLYYGQEFPDGDADEASMSSETASPPTRLPTLCGRP